MIQQYKVKINDLYLTRTGSDGDAKDRYLVDVEINELQSFFLINERLAMKKVGSSSRLWNEMTEVLQEGKRIRIKMDGITFAHFSDLRDIKQEFDETGTEADAVRLILTHPYNSDFDYDLQVSFRSLTYQGIMSTTFRNVELEFTTFGETTP